MRFLPFVKPKNGFQFAGGGISGGSGGGGGSIPTTLYSTDTYTAEGEHDAVRKNVTMNSNGFVVIDIQPTDTGNYDYATVFINNVSVLTVGGKGYDAHMVGSVPFVKGDTVKITTWTNNVTARFVVNIFTT